MGIRALGEGFFGWVFIEVFIGFFGRVFGGDFVVFLRRFLATIFANPANPLIK